MKLYENVVIGNFLWMRSPWQAQLKSTANSDVTAPAPDTKGWAVDEVWNVSLIAAPGDQAAQNQ